MMGERLATTKALRAARIIDAAKTLFFRDGYEAVTMDMVAAEANLSKVTVYKYYPNKQEILFKVSTDWLEAANRVIWPDDLDETQPFDVFLKQVTENFYAVFLTGDAIAARRMFMGAFPKFPELGVLVFDYGPRVILQKLEDYFIRMTQAGRATIRQPAIAAAEFHSLMQSDIELRGLFLCQIPEKNELEARATSSVAMFTHHYGA